METRPVKAVGKESNPFYTIVVVAGTAFVLTAGAYWMDTLRGSGRLGVRPALESTREGDRTAEGGGPSFLDRWGTHLLGGELAILGTAAVLAMSLDRWRSRCGAPRDASEQSLQP
jgi:hypothetical protein